MNFARRDIGIGREQGFSPLDALPVALRKKFEEVATALASKQKNSAETKKKIEEFSLNLNMELSRPKSKLREKLFSPELRTATDKMVRDVAAILGKEKEPKGDRNFEPLTPPENAEPPKQNLFLSEYDGPYAMRMEVNRTAVEKFLALARLDGTVALGSMTSVRTRNYREVNSDGTVAAKKASLFGEQMGENKDENPCFRTIPTQDGWRIEIQGDKILEEVNEKKHKKRTDAERFIEKFNGLLRQGLNECVTKHKFTNAKDTFAVFKKMVMLFDTVFITSTSTVVSGGDIKEFVLVYTMFIGLLAIRNGITNIQMKMERPEFYEDMHRVNPRRGKEVFLHPLRIEDVVLSKTYLEFMGRTLVREKKKEKSKD